MSRFTLQSTSRPADRWTVGPALIVAAATLIAGLIAPALSVQTLFVLQDSVSILGGLAILWREDQYFLFAVLLIFSVLFPAAKLTVAFWVWFAADLAQGPPTALLARLESLGKWSMLDVLVIAILVAALNVTVLSGALVKPGIYLFTLSVILSILAIARIRRIALRSG